MTRDTVSELINHFNQSKISEAEVDQSVQFSQKFRLKVEVECEKGFKWVLSRIIIHPNS